MEGFIAKHSRGKEQWLIRRVGSRVRKLTLKSTVGSEIFCKTITTFRPPKGELKSLEAFRAEKKKAKKKGFEIVNIDSSVSEPARLEVKETKERAKRVTIFGRSLLLDEEGEEQ